jgi:hypothetical protein
MKISATEGKFTREKAMSIVQPLLQDVYTPFILKRRRVNMYVHSKGQEFRVDNRSINEYAKAPQYPEALIALLTRELGGNRGAISIIDLSVPAVGIVAEKNPYKEHSKDFSGLSRFSGPRSTRAPRLTNEPVPKVAGLPPTKFISKELTPEEQKAQLDEALDELNSLGL